MSYDVVVMGSINMDMMVYINDFPSCGDNVVTKGSQVLAGGKGANQAVAVAKQGVKHTFIGAIGNDDSGNQMLEILSSKGVNTSNIIKKTDTQTGTCVAIIDKNGENTCFGMLAANMAITEEDIEDVMKDISGKIFLLQLETSKESVLTALKLAKEKNMFIILDPAPEGLFFNEALEYADMVTPNKMETQKITGIEIKDVVSAEKAAKVIADKGVKHVIIKMGSQGSVYFDAEKEEYTFIKSIKVNAIDTVGAGDTFAGVLASLLSENKTDIVGAIQVATKAAGLKVSRNGGQDAIPTKQEIAEL